MSGTGDMMEDEILERAQWLGDKLWDHACKDSLYLLELLADRFVVPRLGSSHVVLKTMDDPGWLIKLPVRDGFLPKEFGRKRRLVARTYHDWWFLDRSSAGEFVLMCGPLNLSEALYELGRTLLGRRLRSEFKAFPGMRLHTAWMDAPLDTSIRMARWYAWQCDGDWEHEYGIRVERVHDGWNLSIDLSFTEVESVDFDLQKVYAEFRVARPYDASIQLSRAGKQLRGKCGAGAMTDMVGVAFDWIEYIREWREDTAEAPERPDRGK